MFGTANDARKNTEGRVVAGEADLTHPGPIVHDYRGQILLD